MSWKRLVALSGLLLALAALGSVAIADETQGTEPEPKPTGGEKPAEAPPPAAEAPKTHWWGDRFSFFIEANTGGAETARGIDSSIITSSTLTSSGSLDLGKLDFGRLAIGWKLPAEKGMFQLVWSGYREREYTFNAVGFEADARPRADLTQSAPTSKQLPSPVQWWRVRVRDGRLQAHEGVPILEEDGTISYEDDNPDLNASFTNDVADDLQHSAQTLDLLFQREFGGRMFRGGWSSGLRYFAFEGTTPAAAWLGNANVAGTGFTDGTYIHLLPIADSSKGFGPTGSLEAQYRLFRARVVFYAQARMAFVYQTLHSDTGDFFTLAANTDSGTTYPVPSRLKESRTKTSWQVAVEAGVRVRIVEGLQLEVGAGQTSYQDCILVPTQLLIPGKYSEALYGTSALYNTRDFLVSVWHAGVSFQF
jgi:hypothetical protein